MAMSKTQCSGGFSEIVSRKMQIDCQVDMPAKAVDASSYHVTTTWLDEQAQLSLIESYMHEEDA
ncbi:hypothetical protein FLM48_17670 [Shewanella sp. Scap07]|uniref:hypothetical protein n=1 Tax=Shewanella sp. Scap07 TaxID=2589987 RepID=UPI0015B7D6B5|nr:hypothetical protein [Shewanella sp. Scap07]QLE86737.1 hypothetical protein FLM48_17670 [Shewanella sp. Scap07]